MILERCHTWVGVVSRAGWLRPVSIAIMHLRTRMTIESSKRQIMATRGISERYYKKLSKPKSVHAGFSEDRFIYFRDSARF